MNNTGQKMITAFWIQYHWWRIRCLHRRKGDHTARVELHRFRAKQLSSLYEVLSGIRDTTGRVIG